MTASLMTAGCAKSDPVLVGEWLGNRQVDQAKNMPPDLRKYFLLVKFSVQTDATATLEVGGTTFGGRIHGTNEFVISTVLGRHLTNEELKQSKLDRPISVKRIGRDELIVDDPTWFSVEPVRLKRQAAR